MLKSDPAPNTVDPSSFSRTFSRSQVAALIATLVDFGTLTFWVEALRGYYPIGVALGAAMGAITNFFINRHWTFHASNEKVSPQALKYLCVTVGSLILNTVGVYLITEYLHLHYLFSKIIIALSIGFFYNYPLHRFFVYSTGKKHD